MRLSHRWVVGGLVAAAGAVVIVGFVSLAGGNGSTSGERIVRPGVVTTSDEIPAALLDDAVFLVDDLGAGQLSDEALPRSPLMEHSDSSNNGFFGFGLTGATSVLVTVDPAPDQGSLDGYWSWDSAPDRQGDMQFLGDLADALRADGVHVVGFRCRTEVASVPAGEPLAEGTVFHDVAVSGTVDLPSGPTVLRGILSSVGSEDAVDSVVLSLTNGDPGTGMREVVDGSPADDTTDLLTCP
jgi:hypothetical protein